MIYKSSQIQWLHHMIQQMNKIVYILLIMLCTSCALTYDVTPHRCELMQRGEPCLSDHRCCKPTTYYETSPNYYNWWWVTRPNYTNYVIIKPNNNKPRPNNNKPRPNRKPKHRK